MNQSGICVILSFRLLPQSLSPFWVYHSAVLLLILQRVPRSLYLSSPISFCILPSYADNLLCCNYSSLAVFVNTEKRLPPDFTQTGSLSFHVIALWSSIIILIITFSPSILRVFSHLIRSSSDLILSYNLFAWVSNFLIVRTRAARHLSVWVLILPCSYLYWRDCVLPRQESDLSISPHLGLGLFGD